MDDSSVINQRIHGRKAELRDIISHNETWWHSTPKIIITYLNHLWSVSLISMGRNVGILILTDRGRCRPEMTAPFDSLMPSFYMCSVGIFRLSLTVQKLFHVFNLSVKPHTGPKLWGFWRYWTAYRDLMLPPEDTSLQQTASFELLDVKSSDCCGL